MTNYGQSTGGAANGGYLYSQPNVFTTASLGGNYYAPPKNTGSVLVASTQGTGGGTGTNTNTNTNTNNPVNNVQSISSQMYDNINSGYNNYFSQLDQMMNQGLPSQANDQTSIVNNQYQQGANTLGSQQTQGMADLGAQSTKVSNTQASNLRDLSTNLGNLFQSGQNYLGTRGAADSSAANQYAYALAKQGSQQRTAINNNTADLQANIGLATTKLKDTYNTALNNLSLDRDSKISQISQWLSQQQNSLRQAQAQGQISKGQDLNAISSNLLGQALNQLTAINSDAQQQKSLLEQWAVQKATSIQDATKNMAIAGSYQAPVQGYNNMSLNSLLSGNTPQTGNIPLYGGYAGNDTQKQQLF